MCVLSFVVFSGIFSNTVEVDNLTPFIPQGLSGVARASGLVFFAFIGFDMVSCFSKEVINPKVNMPIGIVGSLVLITLIYVAVALAVIAMAPIDLLGGDVPITNALLANACCTHKEQLEPNAVDVCLDVTQCVPIINKILYYSSRFISLGAIFGLTSGCFTSLMGQPRIWYRMSQDGLLRLTSSNNNRNSSKPIIYTVSFTVSSTIIFIAVENEWPAFLVWICSIIAVSTAIMVILLPEPTSISSLSVRTLPPIDDDTSSFKCPLVPYIPLLGILCNSYMEGSLSLISWLFAFIWLAIGVLLYFLYGIHHSTLGRKRANLVAKGDAPTADTCNDDDDIRNTLMSEKTPLMPTLGEGEGGDRNKVGGGDISLHLLHLHRHKS